MRTLFHAAFLATTLVGVGAFANPVYAADLDHYYEPRPVPILPPPPPPCGVYRPCYPSYRRYGYVVPHYRYWVVPPYHRVYDPYNYDHDGYGRPRQNVDRYGYDRPPNRYEHLGFGRLDRYGDEERRGENERFERPRPDFDGPDPYDHG